MDIKLVKNSDKEVEVIINGNIDSTNATAVGNALIKLADTYKSVILNLAGLGYTSSAGLRVISSLQLALEDNGGELAVKNVNDMVMEVFEMTGYAALLKFL